MSEDSFLYRQVADDIRQKILSGQLRPGSRLPPIRSLMQKWGCTPGTIQRAYQELTRQGLLISRPGKGTYVQDSVQLPRDTHLRTAALVHRAESFLLEVLTAGYTAEEAQQAVSLAVDRWQTLDVTDRPAPSNELHFAGSHDLAVKWLVENLPGVQPGLVLHTTFSGSLGGLLALAQGQADLAGAHLWDPESGSYNDAFIRKIFPGRRMAAITLAHRNLGLLVLPGNPLGIEHIEDLARPGVTFVNRQGGSGTRVWLDLQLQQAGIAESRIAGYNSTRATHSEVAQAIIAGQADAGIGLEAVGRAFNLDFVMLTQEQYDLITPVERMDMPPVQQLRAALDLPQVRQGFADLGGYDCRATGWLRLID